MSRWKANSLRELATFFDASLTTVKSQWKASGIIPQEKPEDGYDLQECTQAWLERQRRNLDAGRTGRKLPEGDGDRVLHQAKLESQVAKIKADTERAVRQNELEKGLLLPRNEVERRLIEWAVRFRTPLMRLADKIANRVPGSMKAAVKAEVSEDVRAALTMVRDMTLNEHAIGELIVQEADRLRETVKDE